MRGYLLLVLFSFPFVLTAQKPADYSHYFQKYKDEPAVILNRQEAVRIDLVDGNLMIKSQHKEDKLVLQENAGFLAGDNIYFNETFNSISGVSAQAFIPDGKKFRSKKIEDIEEKTSLSGNIFYDDNRFLEITFPKMDVGSRSLISYKEEIHDPHFLGKFYFTSFLPTEKATYSISFPASVKIKHKVFNDPENRVKVETKTQKGQTTMSWTVEQLPAYDFASDGPSISYYEPHLAVYIDQYTKNGKAVKVLSEVDDLYGWYRELVSGVNLEVDPLIKQLADSLTQGIESEEEKIRAIYYWVQGNIKYVAFEDGMEGFIPRQAAQVCTRRYGDCKDMSSIITDLLKAAEIPASLTWIGSRDIPYNYRELPTPSVDNHMIAAVKQGNDYLFLDATSQHTPIGFPTSFIQGKEALIGVSKTEYQLVKVPVIPKEKSSVVDSVHARYDNGILKGEGKLTASGYRKVDFSRRLNRSPEKVEKYLQGRLEKGHNKFSLEDHAVSGMENKDLDIDISYHFAVPDYARAVNEELYINLNLDRSWSNDLFDLEERKVARETDYKYVDRDVVVMKVPEGYEVDYIPENAKWKSDAFGFTISYKVEGNEVIQTKERFIDTLMIETSQFEDWNNMIKKLDDAYQEVIVLKKTES